MSGCSARIVLSVASVPVAVAAFAVAVVVRRASERWVRDVGEATQMWPNSATNLRETEFVQVIVPIRMNSTHVDQVSRRIQATLTRIQIELDDENSIQIQSESL